MLKGLKEKAERMEQAAVPARDEDAIARAIALTRPGAVLAPADVRALIAGADNLIASGGPKSHAEVRLCEKAEKFRTYGPTRDPEPPGDPELEQQIAEAAAVHAAREAVRRQALEAFAVAQRAQLYARTVDESRTLAERANETELAYQQARADVERAQSVLASLQTQRKNSRRAWLLEQHVR